MARLTDIDEKDAVPGPDYLVHVVDPDDDTDNEAGTSFRMTVANLVGGFIAALGVYFNLNTHTTDDVTEGTANLFMSPAEQSKLAGIASGATANDTDASLKARGNHTGTQAASTISDFTAAADARVVAGVATHVALSDPHTQYQKESEKGVAGGYAELDGTGKVPSAQLPSFVDDVVEAANFAALPVTGESGKIYVTLDTNITYRWSGSAYVEISSSLALGETSSTAYRGDRGKAAYDHSQLSTGNPHNTSKGDVGLGNADNTSDANKPVSTAQSAAISAAQAAAIAASPAETTATVGALINGATAKSTPVDADYFGLMDSAASNILKKLSWANIKAALNAVYKPPRIQSVTSASTVTPSWDNDDQVNITALATNLTLANPSGTPVDGQVMFVRIKGDATPRTIGVGTHYRAIGVTLSTITVPSKTIHWGGKWNAADTKLDILAVGLEA